MLSELGGHTGMVNAVLRDDGRVPETSGLLVHSIFLGR